MVTFPSLNTMVLNVTKCSPYPVPRDGLEVSSLEICHKKVRLLKSKNLMVFPLHVFKINKWGIKISDKMMSKGFQYSAFYCSNSQMDWFKLLLFCHFNKQRPAL